MSDKLQLRGGGRECSLKKMIPAKKARIEDNNNTNRSKHWKKKKKAGPLVPQVKAFVSHFTRLKTVKKFGKKM